MKSRLGFVSNSSSSSFCVYGTYISYNIWEELSEEHSKILEDLGIDEHGDPYDQGETMIGRSWDSIKDDETGLAFKESVQKAMTEIFGEDGECGSHEEGWVNN
jgi:hypothetical protein